MSDKKYLVFAGYADDGMYAIADLDLLIGEMTLQDAYAAIKQHPDQCGCVAIVENGKLLERANFFYGTKCTTEGIMAKGGFEFDEGMQYIEETFKPYTLTMMEMLEEFKRTVDKERGDIPIGDIVMGVTSWDTLNINFTMDGSARQVVFALTGNSYAIDPLADADTVRHSIQEKVTSYFTQYRYWLANGKPTATATGMF